MSDRLLSAPIRYRLLSTVCTCVDKACPCWRARRRGDGNVHCPLCRSASPTLKLDLRGSELRAICDAGCDPDRLRALAEGDDEPLLALYGDGLAPQHARLLLDSAVAPHVAAVRGYTTVPHAAALERLGFSKSQRNAPALVVPVWSVHGERVTYQARPDTPRVKDGKPLKYETPAGATLVLDVPRAVRRDIGNPTVPLFITEGARKADAAASAGLCCVALLGVWSWRGTNQWGGKTVLPDWEGVAFKDTAGVGREVYIAFDSDVMTKPAVFLALTRLKPYLESRGAVVRVVYLPAREDGSKVGLDDFLADGRDIDDLLALATDVLREPNADAVADADERESQADGLIRLGAAGALFCDALGAGYARIAVGSHRECWPLRSKGFRRWLIGAFYAESGRAPNNDAVSTALGVLEAKAQFDSAAVPVHVRIAPDADDGLYLDLGDPDWRAIHVAAAGWEVVADPPTNFVRAAGAQPLPEPIAGGSLDDLRAFVNVTDEDWPLLKAFLRGCLNPNGPYPLLALNGEQGSAKSTTARMLRSLVDPRTPDLRAEPREGRDLMIAARWSWLAAFDNISHLPQWLSDALCRLATGGGFATRELYSDFDESLFDALRPVILTGIADFIAKDDLLDRAVQVTLSAIPDDRRRPEKSLWAAFEEARPHLLGALLDDVVAAVRTRRAVNLPRLPRMADFAIWAVAAEIGRGEPAAFMDAFNRARAAGHEQAIEASPIGAALLAFIVDDLIRAPWLGTSSDLLVRLAALGGEHAAKQKDWPRSARGLSGTLRGLAPALRAIGVTVTFGIKEGKKRSRLMRLERSDTPTPPSGGKRPSASSAPSAGDTAQDSQRDAEADGWPSSADGWTASADGRADGCPGEADGADGRCAPVSVGVGDDDTEEWGEV